MISFIFLCVMEGIGGGYHVTVGNLMLIEKRHNDNGAYTHVWVKGKGYSDISYVNEESYFGDIMNCRLLKK